MPEKTRELMHMAVDCRMLSQRAMIATVREELMEMAEKFERLADHRLKSRTEANQPDISIGDP